MRSSLGGGGEIFEIRGGKAMKIRARDPEHNGPDFKSWPSLALP
jgi:hypothetical protein